MVDKPQTLRFTGELNTDYLKGGLVSLIIPMQPKIAELIGQIAVQWGSFEVRMNACIDSFHAHNRAAPPENWKRKSFKQRKTLFKGITRNYFAAVGWGDEIAPFAEIAATAADLHWRRNIIVHGFYRMGKPNEGDDPSYIGLVAWGEHNGRKVSMEITVDGLQKLYHDIAHLNGEIMSRLLNKGATIDHQDLLVADKDLLQKDQSGSFQTIPIPSMPEPPPQS